MAIIMLAEPGHGPRVWGAVASQAQDAGHILRGSVLKLPTAD